MAERQILLDAIEVGRAEKRCLSQSPPAFGIFVLKQVAPARTSEQDLAGRGYFEALGH